MCIRDRNYGGRPEIVRAVRQLAQQVAEGTLKPEDITEEMMKMCIRDRCCSSCPDGG